MMIHELRETVTDKTNFLCIEDYLTFTARYLSFVESGGMQARIVSRNESHYQFFQYMGDADFQISRPINTDLFYLDLESFELGAKNFRRVIEMLYARESPGQALGDDLLKVIYTVQQSIGCALDALPASRTNTARKINGDLFERLMLLILKSIGVDVTSGTIKVPVKDSAGVRLFDSSYQHDLLLNMDGELKAIGSVKTSSKDRIDKVFVDKFLYNRLTETETPHFAIFLNDVQRKQTTGSSGSPRYGINSTFLTGHFKAYTMKLNALDGVYYCDIRPNMITDDLLAANISTIDRFFLNDVWSMVRADGEKLDEVKIEVNDDIVPPILVSL